MFSKLFIQDYVQFIQMREPYNPDVLEKYKDTLNDILTTEFGEKIGTICSLYVYNKPAYIKTLIMKMWTVEFINYFDSLGDAYDIIVGDPNPIAFLSNILKAYAKRWRIKLYDPVKLWKEIIREPIDFERIKKENITSRDLYDCADALLMSRFDNEETPTKRVCIVRNHETNRAAIKIPYVVFGYKITSDEED